MSSKLLGREEKVFDPMLLLTTWRATSCTNGEMKIESLFDKMLH